MEKRLSTSLQLSAEEFLSSASSLNLKSAKSYLKTLIHAVKTSSQLSSSLPLALCDSITTSIPAFRELLQHNSTNHNPFSSPPSERLRRSSRRSNTRCQSDFDTSANKSDRKKHKILGKLEILAHIAFLCASHPQNAFLPADLLPGVQALHDCLIILESESVLSSLVLGLCEKWWKENFPGRESLISQSLPFLLSRSLTLKKKVDVHRVYALREAFALFDFEDDSIEDLKVLLVRCAISPLYLKTEEGRRFLAFVFGLSNQLTKEMLAMIRSQIPFGRKSMLEAYGDILFRAWKVAEGDTRSELENGFLQDLIEGAIHARTGSLAASIRRLLGAFISQRTTDGVEKLLFQLTEPVIFRSLQVANSNVRQNALHLLLDMFPLEDPDATKEVIDTLLSKQFFLMQKLLTDDCVDVRAVAVEGSCRILHLFWEIIPSPTITQILTKIFDDISRDTCNEVRLSTVNGIIYLLGNPQSHEILKVLLPRLGHLMLDNALPVRIVMVDLLLHLKDFRNFQFNEVVNLDVLLSALASDQSHVAQKITRLLIPSYFPSRLPLEEACNRCVTLIKRSPMAGSRFCEFLMSEGASSKYIKELVKIFVALVLSSDKLSSSQLEGLLVATASLCKNLVVEPCNKDVLKELFSGGEVKGLYAASSRGCARSSLYSIISIICPDDATVLVEDCVNDIIQCSGLPDDVDRQAEVRSAHKLLLSSGAFDEMLEALSVVLQKFAYRCQFKFSINLPKNGFSSAKRKRNKLSGKILRKLKHGRGKKSSNFEDDYYIAVGISWQIRDMLQHEDTRKSILGSQYLDVLFSSLKIISEVCITQCKQCEFTDASPLTAYLALSLQWRLQNVNFSSVNNTSTKPSGCDSSQSNSEMSLEQTLDHMFDCVEKLLGTSKSSTDNVPSVPGHCNSRNTDDCRQKVRSPMLDTSSPRTNSSINTDPREILRILKMLTAVMKFVVDASAMHFASQSYESFLNFISRGLKYVSYSLGQLGCDHIQINEDSLKDVISCLKIFITYAAKLLNLVLRNTGDSSAPIFQVFYSANDLLDLITEVESCLGTGYALRLVAAAKPWLPDLILALGSENMLKHTQSDRSRSTVLDMIKRSLPKWPLVVATTELSRMTEVNSEAHEVPQNDKFTAFDKILGMITSLLKGNAHIRDAVGQIFLACTVVVLERKDFGLVLGLLYFVCLKLFERDDRDWGDLMLASLLEIYPKIEQEIEEQNHEDVLEKLHSVRDLLEPIWMYHICETGRVSE